MSESGFDSFPYLGHPHRLLGGAQHLDDCSLHDPVAQPLWRWQKFSDWPLAPCRAVGDRLKDHP
jgi:hypothetical protein